MTIPRLTKEQAAIIGAFTKTGCGTFKDIQDYAERKLGRPIQTMEFAIPETWKELQVAARDDFIAICHE